MDTLRGSLSTLDEEFRTGAGIQIDTTVEFRVPKILGDDPGSRHDRPDHHGLGSVVDQALRLDAHVLVLLAELLRAGDLDAGLLRLGQDRGPALLPVGVVDVEQADTLHPFFFRSASSTSASWAGLGEILKVY